MYKSLRTHKEDDAPKQAVKHRGRWVVVLLVLALALVMGFFILVFKVVGASLWGFQPAEMAVSQYTTKELVGNLGGMHVSIPRHIPEFVEYDGDPGFGEKRKGPVPERTKDSRIRIFGFDIRYPDMATLSSADMWKDKKSQSVYDTTWLRAGVNSGEDYPGDGFMDRWAKSTVEIPLNDNWWNNYEKLPEKEHGLTVYAVKGIDPETGKPYRQDDFAKDIYLDRNKEGKVTTSVVCSNRLSVSAWLQPCRQNWSMEYVGLEIDVSVSYRRSLLEHWQDIQEKITEFILDFEAKPEQETVPSTT